MTSNSKYIDRHELSTLLDVSYDVVCLNETRWGIIAFKVTVSPRNVRYWRIPTLKKLHALGLLCPRSVNSV